MDKIELCKRFKQDLNSWKINFCVFNNGFHFQVQKEHNFYPSKHTYYNSRTGNRCFYPKFTSSNEFMAFLREQSAEPEKQDLYTATQVVEILSQFDSIEFAMMHFKKLVKRQ